MDYLVYANYSAVQYSRVVQYSLTRVNKNGYRLKANLKKVRFQLSLKNSCQYSLTVCLLSANKVVIILEKNCCLTSSDS